ncbi:hypothetical protein D1007_33615 [Hordeum vulgare]|nr:hypothetical protein D1007_33615 [Hordeum vulgare]
MDEVAIVVIRAQPQILEDHLVVASCTDSATRLAALNDISWCFLESIVGAFDEDYNVFSERDRAYINSRDNKLVPRAAQVTHHYEEGTHDVEASPSSMSNDRIITDICDDEE